MNQLSRWSTILVAAAAIASAAATAQVRTEPLATVKVPQPVLANGQPLAAGTYTLRLDPAATPVAGESAEGLRWIEFVQNGQVVAREMPTVVAGADRQTILKGPGPAPGTAKVELLKGNEYLRIWINSNETHYLIHLPVK